jgi:DNA-binding NtrC family response regulator
VYQPESSPRNCVIIVNDNADLVNLFKDALELQKIETYAFTDAALALKKIKSNPDQFSVVLINYASQLKVPKEKFAKEVKALSKNIKIIITSGLNLSAVDISKDGYDKFLLLPCKNIYLGVNSERHARFLTQLLLSHVLGLHSTSSINSYFCEHSSTP